MSEVVIDNFPQSINADEFSVSVTVKGAKNGTNYLRAEIYKDGTDNYFGDTFNGNDWYGGTDGKQYFPVGISSASMSATIKAKIGESKDFEGSGNYKLKVKRYTASGNAANDIENSVDIKIQIASNLETVQPSFLIQTPILTSEPTLKPSPTPKETELPTVLAESIEINPSSTEVAAVTKNSENSFPVFPALIFALGLILVGMSAYFIYTKGNVSHPKKTS